MTEPLEWVVREVALATGLLMNTVGVVYLVTELPTSVDKMASSVIGPLASVPMRHL